MPHTEAGATVPSKEERRESQRAILIVQVGCKTSGDWGLGHTQDISDSGLLLVTPETFEPRTEITVRFNLPPDPPSFFVETPGAVARVQSGQSMGIQFLQVTERQRDAIAKYVRRVLERGV